MKTKKFINEIQKKLSSGYRVLDLIDYNSIVVISVEENLACIEFEKIRQAIQNQLSNLNLSFNNEITGDRESFALGNIVKATLEDNNSLNISYNLKRVD